MNITSEILFIKGFLLSSRKHYHQELIFLCVLIGCESEHNYGPVNPTAPVLDNQSHAYQVTRQVSV